MTRRVPGGKRARPVAAMGFENRLCSHRTPERLAHGTPRAREAAGKSRSARACGEMHHANVNLKSRRKTMQRPDRPGQRQNKRFPVLAHA